VGCLIRCGETPEKTPVGRDGWYFLSRKRERAKSRNSGESGEWEMIDRSVREIERGVTGKWGRKMFYWGGKFDNGWIATEMASRWDAGGGVGGDFLPTWRPDGMRRGTHGSGGSASFTTARKLLKYLPNPANQQLFRFEAEPLQPCVFLPELGNEDFCSPPATLIGGLEICINGFSRFDAGLSVFWWDRAALVPPYVAG
jgi:hypothetical protein